MAVRFLCQVFDMNFLFIPCEFSRVKILDYNLVASLIATYDTTGLAEPMSTSPNPRFISIEFIVILSKPKVPWAAATQTDEVWGYPDAVTGVLLVFCA
jgi:hypothetical protein